ncbi:hypothetical protein [Marinobacter caseinilyticus]|uniref:hypothetical protein n=1 Tax=Marinobacter caseinilyticus TaxID=2692195 RepID=UPI00140CB7F9|nr:hypothetical protein [Marinobacter caseinilyticus]
MNQNNVAATGVITEWEACQLEQSLEETRSGRLGAFDLMMLSDDDVQEELKHDPLYVSDSLAGMREALEAQPAGNWLDGNSGEPV